MTTKTMPDGDAALRRAAAEIAAKRERMTPIVVPLIIAALCLLGVGGACLSEYYSAGIAFHAAFPTKSDGTGLASELISLRLPIIFCLLLGGVIVRAFSGRAGAAVDGILKTIGFWAILVLLFGIGAFMFASMFLTLGTADDQGFAGHVAGFALAVAGSAMFTLSFCASHLLTGRLIAVVPIIAKGLRERADIRADEALQRETEASAARISVHEATIAEMEKPDALVRKAANEAGAIVGKYIAEAHDLVASRQAVDDDDVDDRDTWDAPRAPLQALQARYDDLKPYTATYFFNLLKQKAA